MTITSKVTYQDRTSVERELTLDIVTVPEKPVQGGGRLAWSVS